MKSARVLLASTRNHNYGADAQDDLRALRKYRRPLYLAEYRVDLPDQT
jgi:hypothetical protein